MWAPVGAETAPVGGKTLTRRSSSQSSAKIGEPFFYVGLELAVVQGLLIGRLTRKFGEARLVVAGAGFIALGLLSLPFAGGLPAVLVVNGLLALGMGLFNPALTSLVSRQAGADERGGIIGVSQSASSLARIVGPAIAGPIFEGFGRNGPYYAAGAVMVLVLFAALPLTNRRTAVDAAPGEVSSP